MDHKREGNQAATHMLIGTSCLLADYWPPGARKRIFFFICSFTFFVDLLAGWQNSTTILVL